MWNCDTCIHKNKQNERKELCEGQCKDVFKRLGTENHCYQEIVEKPLCCGECSYILKIANSDYYVCSVNTWNSDDRQISFEVVRKNYLTKNTPKWCQLK